MEGEAMTPTKLAQSFTPVARIAATSKYGNWVEVYPITSHLTATDRLDDDGTFVRVRECMKRRRGTAKIIDVNGFK